MTNPPPERHWFRFSLRGLMVVVMVLSVGLGWVGIVLKRKWQQEKILEKLEAYPGYLAWDTGYVVRLGFPGTQQVTDAGLTNLNGLTRLVMLDLSHTQVTGTGLQNLDGLTSLEILDLSHTQITDAGLEHLKSMPSVVYLDLSTTQITDEGLEHLKPLTRLETLEFVHAQQITDGGLEHLERLTSLKLLNLFGTQVTEEGVNKLQKALPKCEILWEPESNPNRSKDP